MTKNASEIAALNQQHSQAAQAYQCPADAFKNKVVMVTGAGDGIGKAVALGLADHGATVILLGRTKSKLDAVYDQIESRGNPQAAVVPLDLEQALPRHYNELAALLNDEFGRLDALLHNAGTLGTITPLDQYSPDTWQRVMQVNLNAAFYLTRGMLPLLKQAPSATVTFTTSSVGRRGRAFWGAYAVSKFATEGMVQILADELDNLTRIRVNAINPGACHTEMRQQAYPGEDKSRIARPDDLLPAYFYLIGNNGDFTGLSLDAQPAATNP